MGNKMFHKAKKMFHLHLSSRVSITMTPCRSTIQEMGTKSHSGENVKWRHCFLSLKRPGLKLLIFHVQRTPAYLSVCNCVRCLRGCYTCLVHLPYIARPNTQTIKHCFQIIKKSSNVSLVETGSCTVACCLRFAQRKGLMPFQELCKPF